LLFKVDFYRSVFSHLTPGGAVNAENPHNEAAGHVAFLINVVLGILTGVLIGVLVLPVLMERYPEVMRAFFLGLVLASVVVPWGMIRRKNAVSFVILLLTTVGTAALMGLGSLASGFAATTLTVSTPDGAPLAEEVRIRAVELKFATDTGQKKLKRELSFQPVKDLTFKSGESTWEVAVVANQAGLKSNLAAGSVVLVVDAVAHTRRTDFVVTQPAAASGGQDPATWYVFVCGAIAICAMLLPGISGSFLLLMFGLYGYVLQSARGVITMQDTSGLVPVLIFIAGIVVGILSFSRFLTWLLKHYHDITMAFLAGLMLGSLRALWPFRAGAGHLAQNVMPAGVDSTTLAALGATVVGVVLVAVLNKVGQNKPTPA
jgi:uncharacterized membrane protein